MYKQIVSVSLAALLSAGGLAAAQAQQGPQGQGAPMMQQGEPIERPSEAETGAEAAGERDRPSGMRGMERMHRMMERMERMGRDGGMRGMRDRHHGMRGKGHHRGMRGHGMHRAQMLRTMIILMDTDGDGALSLEEVQSVTERFFNAMDANNDGNLAVEEIRGFYMGGALPGLQDEAEDDEGEAGGNQ